MPPFLWCTRIPEGAIRENSPVIGELWRTRRDSNPQPADSKSDALSIELRVRGKLHYTAEGKLVNFRGLFP